jgi:hypothetical protein
MEQTTSWEANKSSTGQELPRILWNPEGSLPHSQNRYPRLCDSFVTWLSFYGEELLAIRQTSRLEGHPLSADRDC